MNTKRKLIRFGRSLLAARKASRGLCFNRPLVLLQSDDWGRVGVRDLEGQRALREQGIELKDHPYDFYSMETAEDVARVHETLQLHHDSVGRSACIGMNFLVANLDFPRMAPDFSKIYLKPLAEGLPGRWSRPGLFDEYKNGIASGVFFPALHGTMHFCRTAVERNLADHPQRAKLLKKFWRAETPYIYWQMPWIGYEFCDPEKSYGFLREDLQRDSIAEAISFFQMLFSQSPTSACAPGYRANFHTHKFWAQHGICVAQNGSGAPLAPCMDENGLLHLSRTIDLEPSQMEFSLAEYVALAENCFARGIPAIISIHSINFHSTLRDYRSRSLKILHELLSILEARYPNLLYVNDFDLYRIVTEGRLVLPDGTLPVEVKQMQNESRRFVSAGGN